ncbi:double zinc ribbon domain-containing protein [Streptomyces echinatus]|uniref:double zinc ribbon domain-containing protein n=1 Tax=Streptomyces echinatus TaxID=67293 RepID=UPI003830D6BF
MEQKTENNRGNRFCKACGTPAGRELCSRCGAVLDLPDSDGLVEDEGAAVRRDFEGRTQQHEQE